MLQNALKYLWNISWKNSRRCITFSEVPEVFDKCCRKPAISALQTTLDQQYEFGDFCSPKTLEWLQKFVKSYLFLLEIYFILNTFWVTLAKPLRSMHHFAQNKRYYICQIGNEGHLKTIKMFCTATFLCDNNRIIQTLRHTKGNSTFLRVGSTTPGLMSTLFHQKTQDNSRYTDDTDMLWI